MQFVQIVHCAKLINKSNKKHGNKYDYSKVEYLSNKKKVCIICPSHGEFMQTPNDHIGGHNCRKCAEENHINYNMRDSFLAENKNKPIDLYIINLYSENESFIKVGISKEVIKRHRNIKYILFYMSKYPNVLLFRYNKYSEIDNLLESNKSKLEFSALITDNLEYLNNFRFMKKEDREENTLEPSDTYSGIYEHLLRDIMFLHKIPKCGIKTNCILYTHYK